MLAINQRDQRLKFELLIAIESEEKPTACLSFNYHQDHFGKTFGLTSADGEVALLKHYGTNVKRWPASLRQTLGL